MRDEGVQQERHVVARDVEIALVDLGHPGQRIQVLDGRAFGVVDDGAVLAETHAGQIFERLAVGVVHDLAIELPPHHEIDGRGAAQGLFRLGGDGRPDEGHLQLGVRVLHHPGYFRVHVEAGSGGEQHEQFEILGHLDGLRDGDLVRRRVHHFAVGEHAGGIAQPYGIPVGLDFARGRPAGAGAAIEPFKRRRIQKQCSHLHLQSNEFPAGATGFRRRRTPPAFGAVHREIAEVDGQLRLARQPGVHYALHLQRHRDSVPNLVLSYERDLLQEDGRTLHQIPGFLHAQVGARRRSRDRP